MCVCFFIYFFFIYHLCFLYILLSNLCIVFSRLSTMLEAPDINHNEIQKYSEIYQHLPLDNIWLTMENKIIWIFFFSFPPTPTDKKMHYLFIFLSRLFSPSLTVSHMVCLHAPMLTLSLLLSLVFAFRHVVTLLFCSWRQGMIAFDASDLAYDVFIVIFLWFWPETPDKSLSVNYYYRTISMTHSSSGI